MAEVDPSPEPNHRPGTSPSAPEAERAAAITAGLDAIAEWEAEAGPLTATELDAARERIAAETKLS